MTLVTVLFIVWLLSNLKWWLEKLGLDLKAGWLKLKWWIMTVTFIGIAVFILRYYAALLLGA